MSVSISGEGSVTGIDQGLNVVGVVTATQVKVGSAVTIHSGGFQVGSSDIHSTGIAVNRINIGTGASISSPATNVLTLGTNNTEAVRISSSGNLGIGTTNPFAKTHIEINAAAGAGSGSAAVLWLRNSNQTSNNSATIFAGNNVNQACAAINFIHNDYSTDAGSITFDTRTNASTYSERARIDSSGNLGIGVLNPEGKLTINGGNGQRLIIQNSGMTNNQDYGSIAWKNPSGSILGNISLLGNPNSTSDGTCRLSFGTRANNGQTSLVEQLTLDNTGRVLKPYTPHIFGSVTNTTTVSNSFANSFAVVTSTELTFATDRITVPVGGLYLITFCTLSNQDSSRKDALIVINGTTRAQGLSEDTTTGYHYRGISMVMKLAANDYIQFYNQNWYSNTSTNFDAWRTASVTFLG